MHAALRPGVGHAGILDLRPDGVADLLEEIGGQRIVEHGIGRQVVRLQREQGGHRGEADDGGP